MALFPMIGSFLGVFSKYWKPQGNGTKLRVFTRAVLGFYAPCGLAPHERKIGQRVRVEDE